MAPRFGCGRKCHGDARFAAHFRRTQRSEIGHRFQPTGTGCKMNEVIEETAGKAKQTAAQSGELTQLYRQIGISAVAAAARYHEGAPKKPVYASAKDNWQ